MNEENVLSGIALTFSCDNAQRITACAGPGLPWLSRPPDIQTDLKDLWPHADHSKFEDVIRAALTGSESLARTRLDGKSWAFLLHPARNSDGRLAGLLGMVRSVNDEAPTNSSSIDAWPVCIYELDSDGRFSDINQFGARSFGYDAAESLHGTRLVNLLDDEDVPRVETLLRDGYSGRPSHFYFRDQHGKQFSNSIYPYRRSPGDDICCLFGFAHSEAQIPGAELAMAESDQEYRLLVESAPFCIHQIDREGALISMNEAGLRMMGVEKVNDIIGLKYLDAVADEDQSRVARLMSRALAGHASQFEFRSAAGLLFASSFVPIWGPSGKVSRLMGITRDVTQERRSQQDLQESEQRLELALKGANLGLWDWNIATDHLVLDHRWAEMLGYSSEDLAPDIGTMRQLIHPEDHEAQNLRLQAHLNRQVQTYESIHRMRGADGRWRWVVDRGRVTRRDESGKALRITGTSAEITSEYEAENERRELESRLQQAQRMESIGHLAGGIAHDFNNVLTVISGNVDFALDEVESGRSPVECLAQIRRATERASELIGQLMAFSRRRPVRMTVVDLNSLSREIFELVSRVLPENIEFRFDSEPDLPMIEADPSQLEQIVLNLCVNARDAMPQGGQLQLSLHSHFDEDDEAWVTLEVHDNGQGMDAETLSKAFDPFFTTKDISKGSGLGLAMVYGSVRQHGGRIVLDSNPGKGTTVTIGFPACEQSVRSEAEKPVESVNGEETVLVVEDEELVRQLAAKVLGRAGYRVLTAVDGLEGIEVFSKNADRIQIVLLDVVMPRANGGEACRAMLEIRPDIPIVFTSGYNQDNALPVDLMREHDFPVMPKPYDNRTLLKQIRTLLDR